MVTYFKVATFFLYSTRSILKKNSTIPPVNNVFPVFLHYYLKNNMYYCYQWLKHKYFKMNIKSKICIITGATSGIGRETALELARQQAILVLPVRNISKGEEFKDEIIQKTDNANIDIMECDLASFDSIRKFAKAFLIKYQELHILINNAGVWELKAQKSADGIELTFAVNYLAPFLLTNLLLDLMKRSAPVRIINVSSEAHRIGTINFTNLEGERRWNSLRAYSQSKLANILFSRTLSKMLDGDKITVNSLHPGMVATKLFQKFPKILVDIASLIMISPENGAQTAIYLATSAEVLKITGKYFIKKRIKKPAPKAANNQAAEKLWEISLELTGLDQKEY